MTLAWRFVRRSWLRRSTGLVVLSIALLLGAFEMMAAQSLTPQQTVDRDLGRYGAFAGFGAATVPPGSSIRDEIRAGLASTAAADGNIALIAPDFTVPDFGAGSITFTEAQWPGRFGHGLELIAGRQASAAGEVLVANPPPGVHLGQVVSAYGGRTRLTVVGTAYDRYARSTSVRAGAGTWAGLPEDIAADNSVLRGYPVLYWSGADPDAVLNRLASLLVHSQTEAGLRADAEDIASTVRESYADASVLASGTGRSWVERSPAAYTIPSLVLPPLLTVMFFAVNRRWASPARDRMMACGVESAVAVASGWLAVTAVLVAATVAGIVLGWLGGTATATILARLLHLPPPDWSVPVSPAASILGLICVSALAGALTMKHPGSQQKTAAQGAWSVKAARLRQYSGAAVAVAALLQLPAMTSAPRAMVFTGGLSISIVLVMPEIVRWCLTVVPAAEARSRLAVRQLRSHLANTVAVIAILATTLGLATGFTILLDTMIRTASSQSVPDVLPGQVMVRDRGSDTLPPPRVTVETAESLLAARGMPPVQLSYLLEEPGSENLPRVIVQGSDALLIAVDTAEDAARLTSLPLSASERELLSAGGALLWPASSSSRTPSWSPLPSRDRPQGWLPRRSMSLRLVGKRAARDLC